MAVMAVCLTRDVPPSSKSTSWYGTDAVPLAAAVAPNPPIPPRPPVAEPNPPADAPKPPSPDDGAEVAPKPPADAPKGVEVVAPNPAGFAPAYGKSELG